MLDLTETGPTYVSFLKWSAPKLEELRMSFTVSVAKANGFYSGIEHLSSLKEARIYLDGEDATSSECMAAVSAIRKEVGANPNHPALTFGGESDSEGEDNEEQQQQPHPLLNFFTVMNSA